MQKISEMKIQVFTDGKYEYTKAIIYDSKRRDWRDITLAKDGDMHVLLVCADDVRRKFEKGDLKIAKE